MFTWMSFHLRIVTKHCRKRKELTKHTSIRFNWWQLQLGSNSSALVIMLVFLLQLLGRHFVLGSKIYWFQFVESLNNGSPYYSGRIDYKNATTIFFSLWTLFAVCVCNFFSYIFGSGCFFLHADLFVLFGFAFKKHINSRWICALCAPIVKRCVLHRCNNRTIIE